MPRVHLGMSGRESILASSMILTGLTQIQDKSINILDEVNSANLSFELSYFFLF